MTEILSIVPAQIWEGTHKLRSLIGQLKCIGKHQLITITAKKDKEWEEIYKVC